MKWRMKPGPRGLDIGGLARAVRGGAQKPASAGSDARARLASAVGNRAFGRLLQTKLAMGAPGDRYEREADRAADQILGMPASEAQPLGGAPSRGPATSGPAGGALGSGRPLSDSERAFFEPRFGADFRGVRLHSGTRADEVARDLGARAFTVGPDVAFAKGEYAPQSAAGRRLMAHELAHVVQQGAAARTGPATGTAAEAAGPRLSPAPPMVSAAWTSLGSFSWNHHMAHDHRFVLDVLVGSRSDWEQRLRNLDDSDEIWQAKGFLETASDPSAVRRSRPLNQARALNYQNNVTRAPNDGEILEFLRALYNLGEPLDLADHSFEATGITRTAFRNDLNEIISKHQGRLIQDTSAQGRSISSAGIEAVVAETGRSTPIAMIQNAAATAMKAVDLISAARQAGDSTALSNANATIRNAGRTIRYALSAHDAAVAFNKSVAEGVFETVWSTLPGGGALASAGKEILKIGFKKMLDEATKDDEPKKQAEKLLDQFIAHVRAAHRDGHLGSGEVGVLVESAAITGFEAAMR